MSNKCLRSIGFTFINAERVLVTISDLISSFYNFVFALAVFLKFHKHNFNIFDTTGDLSNDDYKAEYSYYIILFLFIWLIGEAIGAVTAFTIRVFGTWRFGHSSKGNDKFVGNIRRVLFLAKFMNFVSFFMVLCGTAGVVGTLSQDTWKGKYELKYVMGPLVVGNILWWLMFITIPCMGFCIYWSLCDVNIAFADRIRNAVGGNKYPKYQLRIVGSNEKGENIIVLLFQGLYYGAIVPIINQLCRVLLCPLPFSTHISNGSENNNDRKPRSFICGVIPTLPAVVLLNFVTIPIRVVAFGFGLIIQAVGWLVFLCCLGPLWVNALLSCYPSGVTRNITTAHFVLWQGHTFMQLVPPLVMLVGLALTSPFLAALLAVTFLLCGAQGQVCSFNTLGKIVRTVFNTVTGSHYGLGWRFDALIICCFGCVLLFLGNSLLATYIFYNLEPATIQTVCQPLFSSSEVAKLWFYFKIVQFSVSNLVPLVRLIAGCKLRQLSRLMNEFQELEFNLIVITVLELYVTIFQELFALNGAAVSESEEYAFIVNRIDNIRTEVANRKAALLQQRAHLEESIRDIAYILFDFGVEDDSDDNGVKTPLMSDGGNI